MSIAKVKCNCKHEYQDNKYGIGNRIATLEYGKKRATCTVCLRKHDVKQEDKK